MFGHFPDFEEISQSYTKVFLVDTCQQGTVATHFSDQKSQFSTVFIRVLAISGCPQVFLVHRCSFLYTFQWKRKILESIPKCSLLTGCSFFGHFPDVEDISHNYTKVFLVDTSFRTSFWNPFLKQKSQFSTGFIRFFAIFGESRPGVFLFLSLLCRPGNIWQIHNIQIHQDLLVFH